MSSQSAASYQAERYVRCCPLHGCPLEEHGTQLICPKGRHAVAKFKVIDRKKGTAELVPVDGDHNRGGVEIVEKVPAAVPPATPGPRAAAAKAKPVEVLLRTKFRDEAGNVLWVRLMKETKKSSGVVYLVRWSLHEEGAEKAKTRPLAADPYQEKARKVYDDECEKARKLGWTEVIVLHREIEFVPLPAPAKKRR